MNAEISAALSAVNYRVGEIEIGNLIKAYLRVQVVDLGEDDDSTAFKKTTVLIFRQNRDSRRCEKL